MNTLLLFLFLLIPALFPVHFPAPRRKQAPEPFLEAGLPVRTEEDKAQHHGVYPEQVLEAIRILNSASIPVGSQNPYDILDTLLSEFGSGLRRSKLVPDTPRNAIADQSFGLRSTRLYNVDLEFDKISVPTGYIDIFFDPVQNTASLLVAPSYPLKRPRIAPIVFPSNLFPSTGPLQLRNSLGLFEPYLTTTGENHLYPEDIAEHQAMVEKNTALIREMATTGSIQW